MNNNNKESKITDQDLGFDFFGNKAPIEQRIAVFVTTKHAVAETGGMTGKWFILGDYASKYDFIESATEFACVVLDDAEPEFIFTHYHADVNIQKFISRNDIDEQLWAILTMSTQTVEIVNYWYDRYGLVDQNVRTTACIATQYYEGHFDGATTEVSLYSEYIKQQVALFAKRCGGTGINELRATVEASVLAAESEVDTSKEIERAQATESHEWAGKYKEVKEVSMC